MDLSNVSPATNANAPHRLLEVVPDEIWVQIFLASIEGNGSLNPFFLTAVCADWRRIALANTVLWDTLSIRFLAIFSDWNKSPAAVKLKGRFQAKVDALKMWIGRAGTRPLSIKLETCQVNLKNEVAEQVPRIIVAHASQIVSLNMCIYEAWCALFRGVEFPQLRALCLHHPTQAPIGNPLDFSRSPRLSVVKAEDTFKSIGIMLLWTQIVDVDLSRINAGGCLEALDLLPNLERCSFNLGWTFDDDGHMEWTAETQRRGSPTLTVLKLEEAGPLAIQKILDSLPLTLQELDLNMISNLYDADGPRKVLNSIASFAGTLRALILPFTPLYLTAFEDLLRQLHRLEKLDICVHTSFDDHFFFRCFAQTGMLPRLSQLTVGEVGDELGDETIMAILRYRWHLTEERDCVKIKDVRFQFRSSSRVRTGLDPAMKAQLKDMIENGLNVVITYGSQRITC